ncbi:Polysaccharide biosynthesis protein [Candidatus Methanoperedenaceae archaeon GB50]|nr:Polysaccharide biosynthesis protein [Candidatus Methanoperedenaceae archaeon GB50]CAD7780179.1 MAG: Polysaccharide biosynthesis protein [Candidatus Methanoperedenaceae archaeon GB50]
MNTVQRIAKNTGVLGISQVITSILGFFLLICIARYLGEAGFGKYSFAVSFTALFIIFADLGISQLIIRELARNKELTDEYLTNVSVIKLLLSFLAFALIALTINLMDFPQDTTYAVYFFGVYMILTSFALTFRSIFQAYERMEYDAAVMVIEKIILIILVLFVLISGYGLIELAYAYVFAGIVAVVISIYIVLVKIAKPKPTINLLLWKMLIVGSIPFGLNALFGVLFFKIDTVMLSVFKDDAAVGIYNAAYVPLLALTGIISGMVVSALYPVMSRYFISSKDSLETFTVLSSKYMAIIGFPIGMGCFVLADRFIALFYLDQYSASIIAFQILALFIPIRLVSSITGTLLTSINKQILRTVSVGLSALFNIVLNAVMIPYLSYVGASIATVLSEVFLYFVFIYFINKHYKKLELYKHFIKPLVASLVMGGFVFYFIGVNLFLLILLAAFVYFMMLLLLRTFTQEDKDIFKQVVKRG